MTINTSNLTSSGLPKLAADLLFFDRQANSAIMYSTITIPDPSAGLVTALSLTGQYMINSVGVWNLAQENVTLKLTIDGTVIINNTFLAVSQSISVINSRAGRADNSVTQVGFAPIQCDSTFLLEIQTTADASVNLEYNVRPIL